MFWDQFTDALAEALATRCQLEVLVLHLGKNNLVTCSVVRFLARLVEEITRIRSLMPRCLGGHCPGRCGMGHVI